MAAASGETPIAVSLNEQVVICPNNGVITLLAEHYAIEEARAITNPNLLLSEGGQIYYARDVFAPAAALLASGAQLEEVGAPVEKVVKLDLPRPKKESEGLVSGRVMHVNRFGTLVTNVHRSFLEGSRVTKVEVGHFPVGALSETYADVEQGFPVAIFGSAGYLEIAYNGDSAGSRLDIGVGILVEVAIDPAGG